MMFDNHLAYEERVKVEDVEFVDTAEGTPS